jgi:hypothetical protein
MLLVRIRTMTFRTVRARGVALLFASTLVHRAASAAGEAGAPGVFYLSSGRLGAITSVLIGLTGVVSGVRALRSARRAGNETRRFPVALVAGPLAVVLGGWMVATAPGGVGTGNGLGGAVVGVVLGLIAIGLGALSRIATARAPSRR